MDFVINVRGEVDFPDGSLEVRHDPLPVYESENFPSTGGICFLKLPDQLFRRHGIKPFPVFSRSVNLFPALKKTFSLSGTFTNSPV